MWKPATWYADRILELGAELESEIERRRNRPRPAFDRSERDARLDRDLAGADQRRWADVAGVCISLALRGMRAFDPSLLPRLLRTPERVAWELQTRVDLEDPDEPVDVPVLVQVCVALEPHMMRAAPEHRTTVASALALGWCRAGDVSRALRWLDRMLDVATGEPGSEVVDSVGDLPSGWPHASMVAALRTAGASADRRFELARGALERIPRVDGDAAVSLFASVVAALVEEPASRSRDALLDRALAVADELEEPAALGCIIGVWLAKLDRARGERELAARIDGLAGERQLWRMWLRITYAFLEVGDRTEALAHLARAERALAAVDRPHHRYSLAWAAAKAGLAEGVLAIVDGAVEPLPAHGLRSIADAAIESDGPPQHVDALVRALLARPELRPGSQGRGASQTAFLALQRTCFALANGLDDPDGLWNEARAAATDDHDRQYLVAALRRARENAPPA